MLPLHTLVVDDDPAIVRTVLLTLKSLGVTGEGASSAEQALTLLRAKAAEQETPCFDLILTDMRMAEMSGVELVREATALNPTLVCVVMTAFASYDTAVSAIQAGAFDYLPKPFSAEQLGHLVTKVGTVVALRRENAGLRASLTGAQEYFFGLTAPASLALQNVVHSLAPSDVTVLLTGETGSGKTALARSMHRMSGRAKQPFVELMCTTLSEQLFESEVFGHVRGAFTGAVRDHKGKFEAAQGGTLFLDEIGELSLATQAKLLRCLEDKVIERVGDCHPVQVDVRIIAATNQDLAARVREKRFREDLYYRLNIFECHVAPLRDRQEDIAPLAQILFRAARKPVALEPLVDAAPLPSAILHALQHYAWPGNVRELRNVMERIAVLSAGRVPAVQDLPPCFHASNAHNATEQDLAGVGHISTLQELEEQHIRSILHSGISMEKAAEVLGITTVTLWRKRKEYGLL